MPGLPKTNRDAETVSFYLDNSYIRRLDKLADRIGSFRSQLIAGMVRKKIRKVEKDYEILMEDHTLPPYKLVVWTMSGKRLTYSELTGKEQSPRHEATGTGERPIPSSPCRACSSLGQ
jgi:hypothetical protein